MIRPVLAAAGAVLLAACPGAGNGPGASACEPPSGELPLAHRGADLVGEYRLTLVATAGPRMGRTASGTLHLRPYGEVPPPLRPEGEVTYPVYGSTDLRVSEVGAVAPGQVGTDSPAAPGVLGVEWPRPAAPYGTRTVALRLGAEGNREERLRFDGSSLALFVTTAGPDGFGGRWESGAGEPVAAGHFCAVRAGT